MTATSTLSDDIQWLLDGLNDEPVLLRGDRAQCLLFQTMDEPEDVDKDLFSEVFGHLRQTYDLDFDVLGGSKGCFNAVIGLNRSMPNFFDFGDQLVRDNAFIRWLRKARVVRYALGDQKKKKIFNDGKEFRFLYCTGRNRESQSRDDRAQYGNLEGPESYGLARVFLPTRYGGEDIEESEWVSSGFRHIDELCLNLPIRERAVVTGVEPLVDRLNFIQVFGNVKAERRALIYVHGFKTSFEDSLKDLCGLLEFTKSYNLNVPFVPILFSWPGDYGLFRKYQNAQETARTAGLSLSQLLATMTRTYLEHPIDLACHSHGANVVLDAVLQTNFAGLSDVTDKPIEKTIRNLVFFAPDAYAPWFEMALPKICDAAELVTNYATRKDAALKASKLIIRSLKSGRAGQGGLRNLEIENFENIDVSEVAAGSAKHSSHLFSPVMVEDVSKLFSGHSAEKRGVHLRPHESGRKGDWMFVLPH